MQAFKPILLSAPGEEPIVLLDPLKLRDHGIVVGLAKSMRLNHDLVELR